MFNKNYSFYKFGIAYALMSSMVIVMLSSNVILAKDYGEECNKKIPVPVPSFSCSDGTVVPKTITGGKCKKPEDLYARCVYNSTLGRLAKDNKKNVDIIFSCRKDFTNNHKGDNGKNFYDIAVIQHDRNTGNTCFYQYISPTDKDSVGEKLPAPGTAKGKSFWNVEPDFCTSCHTNGPFVRSPHYEGVKDKAGDVIIPSVYDREFKKYKVLHPHFEVHEITKSGNACMACHSIGAYTTTGLKKNLRIGEINKLASGTEKSLRSHPSPTKSGYDDFMVGQMDLPDRAATKAALKELEGCLTKPAKTKGCKITKISPPNPVLEKFWNAILDFF